MRYLYVQVNLKKIQDRKSGLMTRPNGEVKGELSKLHEKSGYYQNAFAKYTFGNMSRRSSRALFRCWWLVPELCVYYRCAEIPLRDHQHSLVFLFINLARDARVGGRHGEHGRGGARRAGLAQPSPAQPSLA